MTEEQEEIIPGFVVKAPLGKGGMAAVFRADSDEWENDIALKILFPERAEDTLKVKRFHREGELLKRFDHKHIVQGLDHGKVNDIHYQVQEIIKGKSVENILHEQNTLSEEHALEILMQICQALQYMHEQGVIHRDVKPGNILINQSGTVKLCDLGFALSDENLVEDRDGMTVGTSFYMSPEQAQGKSNLDIRSDIYSLGATLYHMLIGDVPFSGTQNHEVMAKQVLQQLEGEKVKDKISRHMHYLIEKMMSKKKDFRFQSPEEIIEEISSYLEAKNHMEFQPDEDESPF